MTRITRLKAIALMLIMIAALSQKQPASKAATPAAATIESAGALDGTNESLTGCAGVSFSEALPPVAGGPNPSSVVSGDFNLDGKADLAMASASFISDTVTVLLGEGKGRFTPAPGSPVAVGRVPQSLAVGDFNLDGKPDLATANSQSSNVTILLGEGDGRFKQPAGSPVNVGEGPFSVGVGDFNLDGKPDLAVARSTFFRNVVILLGDGSGGFKSSPGSPMTAGINPISLAVGEFNQDGKPDLVIASSQSNNVTILLGNGDGSFGQPAGSPIATGTFPRCVAVGDFNKDGRSDLAVASQVSSNVTILLGVGSGRFIELDGGPIVTRHGPVFVAIKDFNFDGTLDLALANEKTDNVTILLGDGRGSFIEAAGSPIGAGDGPWSIAVGEFNQDGRPDLAVANFYSDKVTIQVNTCTAVPCARMSFNQLPGSPVSAGVGLPLFIAAGNFNSDLRTDLVVVGESSNKVSVLFSNRGFGFTPGAGPPVTAGQVPTCVAVGDFNLVPGSDLAVANYQSDNVTILLNDNSNEGNYKEASYSPIAAGRGPSYIAAADFTNDGKPDLAVVNFDSNDMTILLNEGGSGFKPASYSPVRLGRGPISLAVGDFNGDRYADVAVTNRESNNVTVLQNATGSGFVPFFGSPVNVGINPVSIATGDFNLDRKLDLAVANRTSNDVTILLGLGDGRFAPTGLPVFVGRSPSSIAVGDFSQDGKPDFAVATAVTRTIDVLAGNGLGSFAPLIGSPIAVGSNPVSLAAGDFNQDGNADLAVANNTSNDVSILLANGSGGLTQPPGSTITVGLSPDAAAIGDFNQDGKLDMATANTASNNVTILLGNIVGSFTQPVGSPIGVGRAPSCIAAGDFDLDGKRDLAVGQAGSNALTILRGDGAGGFAPLGSPIIVGSAPASVVLDDFNQDGKPDLAVGNADSDNLTILLGNGRGGFSSSATGIGSSPRSLAVGDFNRDGKSDLAVATTNLVSRAGQVIILSGDGSGRFTRGPAIPVADLAESVAIGDFNRDGKSDLAVASSIATNNVTILLGDGKGAFTPPAGSPLTVGPLPVWLAVGDFDLDGKPDLTVASGGVTVLLGDGNGGFSEPGGSPVTALVASVYVEDFNLDGKPELAVVNRNNNSITVQFNTCTSRTGP